MTPSGVEGQTVLREITEPQQSCFVVAASTSLRWAQIRNARNPGAFGSASLTGVFAPANADAELVHER